MNHYERLGVNKNANDADIKTAFRAKAKEHHPDIGGDSDEFVLITKAYEVLSDPKRRLLYDKTGQDQNFTRDAIQIEANNLLLQLFNQAIKQDESEVLSFIEKCISENEKQMNQKEQSIKERQQKLKNKREKITSKGKQNFAWMIIDEELKQLEGTLLNLENIRKINKAMRKELKKYDEEIEPKEPQFTQLYVRGGFISFGE